MQLHAETDKKQDSILLPAGITSEEAQLLDKILKAAGFEDLTNQLISLIHTTFYSRDPDTTPLLDQGADWIDPVRI